MAEGKGQDQDLDLTGISEAYEDWEKDRERRR